MARQDGKRNFALRDSDGNESSVYSGQTPRQAALKAARDHIEVSDSEDEADVEELRLRERGSRTSEGLHRVHVYDAWAWREAAPDDAPDFLGDTVTNANVSKQSVDHIDYED